MATPQQKAFCVLRFNKCELAITVQHDFRRTYGTKASTAQRIRRRHQTFQESGCLFAQKRSGRPRASDKNIECVRQSFVRSPQKSTRRAGLELDLPRLGVFYDVIWYWRHTEYNCYKPSYRITNKKGLIFAISYPKNKNKMSNLSHALFFRTKPHFI